MGVSPRNQCSLTSQQTTTSSNSTFSIVYFNARSLLHKIDYLRLICMNSRPDIVCIVESWMENEISDAEIAINGYDVIRADRNRHGGGVLIYINKTFIHRVIFRGDHELELLIVSVSNCFGRCVCLGVLYRPPDAAHLILDCVSNVLCKIDSNLSLNFVLIDFNIGFNNTNHYFYNQLTSFMSSFSLTQVVPPHFPACYISVALFFTCS